MESQTLQCLKHDRINEIYCSGCNTYICPRCISDHTRDGHKAEYFHIIHHSPIATLPKFDVLLSQVTGHEKEKNEEALAVILGMNDMNKKIDELLKSHEDNTKYLKKSLSRLASYCSESCKEYKAESLTSGLVKDKERLDKALAEKKVKDVLTISQRVVTHKDTTEKLEAGASMVEKLEKSISVLSNESMFNEIMKSGNMLLTKCQALRLVQYNSDWVLDRTYLSHKMSLGSDFLTYKSTVSGGYPAIIANFSADQGYFAYEVVPTSLCCSGKEGFGIIEREMYLEAYGRDPTTPTAHVQMIGVFHPGEVHNMKAETSTNLIYGARYVVKCNLVDHLVTIKGPGLSLYANLVPGVSYTPCFSCGCTSNQFKIRPLVSFDELD